MKFVSRWFARDKQVVPAISPAESAPEPALTLEELMLQELAEALRQADLPARRDGDRLMLESGLQLRPVLLGLDFQQSGHWSSGVRMEMTHAGYFPAGIAEFVYAAGDSDALTLRAGFVNWIAMDLRTLLEAFEPEAGQCSRLKKTLPATDATPELLREITLGDPSHHVKTVAEGDECHPFCSCCFVTQNMEVFMPLIESDQFVALRLFASRGTDGLSQADCRINGEDYPAGQAQLLKYVETWPQRGFEMRKQYVVIRTRA